MVGQLTVQPQRDDLAGARVAADPQLRVQTRLGGASIAGHDHDHPARMLAAGEVGRLDGVLEQIVGVKRDHEREHPAQRDRAALFAKADDLLVDVVGRRVRRQID